MTARGGMGAVGLVARHVVRSLTRAMAPLAAGVALLLLGLLAVAALEVGLTALTGDVARVRSAVVGGEGPLQEGLIAGLGEMPPMSVGAESEADIVVRLEPDTARSGRFDVQAGLWASPAVAHLARTAVPIAARGVALEQAGAPSWLLDRPGETATKAVGLPPSSGSPPRCGPWCGGVPRPS